MIREVELVSYLPEFMQSYKEPVAALDAQNPEFQIIWNAVDKTLCNQFISTADEYGISRFEKILGIYPSDVDTLESRRSRVQSKWFNKIPYTIRVLLEKLKVLCDDTDFSVTYDFDTGYSLKIVTSLVASGQLQEVKNVIEELLPCNVYVERYNLLSINSDGDIFMVGGVTQTQVVEITNQEGEI